MKKAYIIRIIIAGTIGILSLLAVFGLMYPIKIMNLQFCTIVEKLLSDFSIPVLLLFISVLITAYIFGRVSCSLICPFGIMQEGFDILFKRIAKKKKKNSPHKNYKYKYIIAFVVFSVLLGGSTVLIKYFDPYAIFANAFSFSLIGIIISVAVIVVVFYKNRFFCTNICPVGAVLGLISKYSILKINMDKSSCAACGVCARSCPSGCINIKAGKIDNEICVKCFKCVRVCPTNSINYSLTEKKAKKKMKKTKFSPTRREALIGIGAFGAFSALVAAGVTFSKKMAVKITNLILPPGAESANRMANKCTNCNLCVNNCPTRILSKADSHFGAVHIDYSKGERYCDYNCNNCGNVCPTGAIKKMSLEEKQTTKIALAKIDKSKCMSCGRCQSACPTGAIEDDGGKYKVNKSMCIGCGKCQKICDAITIHPIEKQITI